MVDTVTKNKRSEMMSKISSKNTKPEIQLRRLLHKAGYRYRLHSKDLQGSPDLVLKKYKICIFVHGCFWHKHQSCKLAHTPKSRVDYWTNKLNKNVLRDEKNIKELISQGWRVMVVWECFVKNKATENIFKDLEEAIVGSQIYYEYPPCEQVN